MEVIAEASPSHQSGDDTQRAGANSTQRRKRPHPDEEAVDNDLSSLFPAAAAMKKRRLETGDVSDEPTSKASDQKKNTKAVKKRPKSPEIDIIEVARQQREAEEEAARKDAETMRELILDPEISKLRNLAIIEEMHVRPRPTDQSSSQAANQGIGANAPGRWKEEWAGRKNFKLFRRKGVLDADGPTSIRGHHVIVQLEEAKKKGYGMGGDYRPESTREESHAVSSARRRHADDDDGEDDGSQFRRIKKGRHDEAASAQAGAYVESTPAETITQTARENPSRSEQVTQATQSTNTSKRKIAIEPVGRKPPAKKIKATPQIRDEDNSSEDDDLRFKFRRKKA